MGANPIQFYSIMYKHVTPLFQCCFFIISLFIVCTETFLTWKEFFSGCASLAANRSVDRLSTTLRKFTFKRMQPIALSAALSIIALFCDVRAVADHADAIAVSWGIGVGNVRQWNAC